MHPSLRYIQGYPQHIVEQVKSLVDNGKLIPWFEQRYPLKYQIKSEKALFGYVMVIKNQFMKKTAPVSKVAYDNKIHNRYCPFAKVAKEAILSRVKCCSVDIENSIFVTG